MLAVVTACGRLGVVSERVGLLAMTREVSGERRGALVALGSARRATARTLGLGVVAAFLLGEDVVDNGVVCEANGMCTPLAGSAMRCTALGVGVTGGGIGVSVFGALRFGVEGAGIWVPPAASGGGEAFLLRDLDVGAAGGGIFAVAEGDSASTGVASARALRRTDLRQAIGNATGKEGFTECKMVCIPQGTTGEPDVCSDLGIEERRPG